MSYLLQKCYDQDGLEIVNFVDDGDKITFDVNYHNTSYISRFYTQKSFTTNSNYSGLFELRDTNTYELLNEEYTKIYKKILLRMPCFNNFKGYTKTQFLKDCLSEIR